MLVLTERQAVAFDALMSLGTEGALKAIIEHQIENRTPWSRTKLKYSPINVDLSPLEYVDTIKLIIAVSKNEYGVKEDKWEDVKGIGEALLRLSQGYPIRSMVNLDDVYDTYYDFDGLKEIDEDEVYCDWQYLNKK